MRTPSLALLTLVSLNLFAAACGPTVRDHRTQPGTGDGTGTGNDGTQTGGASPVVASIERTACFGTCPMYKLAVHADGTVDYEGENFVKLTGKHTGSIEPEQVAALEAAFAAAGFAQFADSYEKMDVTDNPSVILSFTKDGQEKTVRHYHGDRSAPPELTALENDFDRIVGSEQWIGGPDDRKRR